MMTAKTFFSPIPAKSPDEVRGLLEQLGPGSVTLIDVRQREEYEEGHLQGAVLMPLDELPERVQEVDRKKPTVVYCRKGGRGGNGTAVLVGAGHGQVWNLTGGLEAWNGVVATGAPEAGMAWFDPELPLEDHIGLAFQLEHGAMRYYEGLTEHASDNEGAARMFAAMAKGEIHHKRLLRELYTRCTGRDEDPPFPLGDDQRDIMEGGVLLPATLTWARRSPLLDVLEFTVALEANAHDRYLKFARQLRDAHAREVFERLVREERAHMKVLLEAFQQLYRTGAGA